eukprot:1209089-Rhodomonas_salina.1
MPQAQSPTAAADSDSEFRPPASHGSRDGHVTPRNSAPRRPPATTVLKWPRRFLVFDFRVRVYYWPTQAGLRPGHWQARGYHAAFFSLRATGGHVSESRDSSWPSGTD